MDQQVVASHSPEESAKSVAQTKSKPSYKHVPHSQKPAHLVAKRNARERRRVQAVNQAFYRLRKCVPIENRNKRVSKVKTLLRAIDYIRKLERILADDDEAGQPPSLAQVEGPTSGCSIEPQVAAHKTQQRKEERRLKRGSAGGAPVDISEPPPRNTRSGGPKTGRAATTKLDRGSTRNKNNQPSVEEQATMLAPQDDVFQQAAHSQQVQPSNNNCHQQPIYQQQHHLQATQDTILRDSSAYHSNLNYYTLDQCCGEPYDINAAPPSLDQAHQLNSTNYLPSAGYYTPDASSSPHIGLSTGSVYAPADSTTGSLYALEVAAESADWCKRGSAGAPSLEPMATRLQQLSAVTRCPVPEQEACNKHQQPPPHHQIPGREPPTSALLRSTGSCSSGAADSPSGADNSSTTATARRPPAAANHRQHPGAPHQAPMQHQQQVSPPNNYLAYAAEARAVHLSFAVINDNNNASPSSYPAHQTRRQPDGGGHKGPANNTNEPAPHHQLVGLQREQHSPNNFHVYLQNQQHHHPQHQPPPPHHQQPPSFLNHQHVQQAANHSSAPHLGPASVLLPLHHRPTIQEYTS